MFIHWILLRGIKVFLFLPPQGQQQLGEMSDLGKSWQKKESNFPKAAPEAKFRADFQFYALRRLSQGFFNGISVLENDFLKCSLSTLYVTIYISMCRKCDRVLTTKGKLFKTRPSVNYANDWLDHSFLFPGLVGLKKSFTLDVITRGQSTSIFLCIGPFLAWWRTNDRTTRWS